MLTLIYVKLWTYHGYIADPLLYYEYSFVAVKWDASNDHHNRWASTQDFGA